jgi:hypothetical protein
MPPSDLSSSVWPWAHLDPGSVCCHICGAVANIVGLLLYGNRHFGLGASGIMGASGLLSAQWLGLLRHGLAPGTWPRAVCSACLLLVLLGFNPSPNVDYVAHVAGFFAAIALGATLAFALPARTNECSSTARPRAVPDPGGRAVVVRLAPELGARGSGVCLSDARLWSSLWPARRNRGLKPSELQQRLVDSSAALNFQTRLWAAILLPNASNA